MRNWHRPARRALPVQLPFPQRTELTARVALPRGFVAALPEGSEESGPQGSWSVRYGREDGQVVARLSLELRGGTLLPKEYGAFRAFLGRLDQVLLRKVEAAPGNTTAFN